MHPAVELVRIEPRINARRFYHLWLEPDLFAPVRLVRFWGRIGTRGGRYAVKPFDTIEAAQQALEEAVAYRIRRGYRHR
ncbi:WGR domain-containing protein [Halorhodospira halophila]|uniref:WGR domain-containing protein n=1 Tax=Halorhodospira halophila TaxID=1053 RepID=UPI001914D718|nr:WGR domain-containing protein [Halorhodospira halophila]MBK5935486.1 hypothetical protein [Halorhodospira halophila]